MRNADGSVYVPPAYICVMGVVKSIQGTNPGPADGITYTIIVTLPSGGTIELAGVKPMNQRPTATDIKAAEPGTMLLGFQRGSQFYFQIIEQHAPGGCDS